MIMMGESIRQIWVKHIWKDNLYFESKLCVITYWMLLCINNLSGESLQSFSVCLKETSKLRQFNIIFMEKNWHTYTA